ncbi:MAG TPA: RibD family protein [Roseiflexaceae bacterium]|nr:RibD family protein [Roseiflexaceae bacterium]
MKPYVICHMMSSVDGRILPDRWHPAVEDRGVYERLHNKLAGDAWLVGRVTGQEFAVREAPYPAYTGSPSERQSWFAQDADAWGIVLDAEGKIAWGRSDVGGDPLLVVLTTAVPDSHLAGLREDGVSYIFAGEREIDLAVALETLNRELGIGRLLLEGGGAVNGSLLQAGLVDELSLVIAPSVDGVPGGPAVIDIHGEPGALNTLGMALESCEVLEGGLVWLRYRFSRHTMQEARM